MARCKTEADADEDDFVSLLQINDESLEDAGFSREPSFTLKKIRDEQFFRKLSLAFYSKIEGCRDKKKAKVQSQQIPNNNYAASKNLDKDKPGLSQPMQNQKSATPQKIRPGPGNLSSPTSQTLNGNSKQQEKGIDVKVGDTLKILQKIMGNQTLMNNSKQNFNVNYANDANANSKASNADKVKGFTKNSKDQLLQAVKTEVQRSSSTSKKQAAQHLNNLQLHNQQHQSSTPRPYYEQNLLHKSNLHFDDQLMTGNNGVSTGSTSGAQPQKSKEKQFKISSSNSNDSLKLNTYMLENQQQNKQQQHNHHLYNHGNVQAMNKAYQVLQSYRPNVPINKNVLPALLKIMSKESSKNILKEMSLEKEKEKENQKKGQLHSAIIKNCIHNISKGGLMQKKIIPESNQTTVQSQIVYNNNNKTTNSQQQQQQLSQQQPHALENNQKNTASELHQHFFAQKKLYRQQTPNKKTLSQNSNGGGGGGGCCGDSSISTVSSPKPNIFNNQFYKNYFEYQISQISKKDDNQMLQYYQ